MAEASREQLLADIKSINKDTNFSDLTIKCGADTYNVHKNVVAARASVFAKALKFPGKESGEGIIDLSDNEPAVIKLLVQYLYEAEYDPVLSGFAPSWDYGITPQHTCDNSGSLCRVHACSHHYCGLSCYSNCKNFVCVWCLSRVKSTGDFQGTANDMVTHAKMYEMADKYDISGLKELCIEKYKQACIIFWDDPKFAESAYRVYSTTPTRDKGLRNIVCKIISLHMELLKKPEIEGLIHEFPVLAEFLLFDKAEQAGWCK